MHAKVNKVLSRAMLEKRGQQEALIIEAALCRGYGWSLFPAVDINSDHTKEDVTKTLIFTFIEPILTAIHLVLSHLFKTDI